MTTRHMSRDPGRFCVDRGREIPVAGPTDETTFGEQEILSGLRQAENERLRAAGGQGKDAPGELFLGRS